MSFVSNFRNQTMSLSQNQLIPIYLGLQLYLYISFLRGFLSSIIVYVVDTLELPQYVGAICAIIPILVFPLLVRRLDINLGIKLAIITWVLAVLSPFLLLNLFLFIIGLTLSYSNLTQFKNMNGSGLEYPLIGVTFLFLDNIFRGFGSGNDPSVTKHPVIIIFILMFTALFFILPNVVVDSTQGAESEIQGGGYYLGLILSLTIYFLYFGNSGLVVYHMGLTGAIALSVYFLCNLIAVGVLIYYPDLVSQPRIVLIGGFSMLIVVSLTWERIAINIFWWFGLIGNILLISYYVNEIIKVKPATPWFLLGALVVNLGLLFFSITKDGVIYPLVIAIIAILPLLANMFLENGGSKV